MSRGHPHKCERKNIMKRETAHRTAYGYEYKGKCIRKHIFWEMVYWRVDDKEFNTLKEAKAYIDEITK
jgi:hypothetical protein